MALSCANASLKALTYRCIFCFGKKILRLEIRPTIRQIFKETLKRQSLVFAIRTGLSEVCQIDEEIQNKDIHEEEQY